MENTIVPPTRIVIKNGKQIKLWEGFSKVKSTAGAFNMICSAVERCFKDTDKFNEKDARIKFTDSKIFQAFCDCSENFEYNKLKTKIIKFNR